MPDGTDTHVTPAGETVCVTCLQADLEFAQQAIENLIAAASKYAAGDPTLADEISEAKFLVATPKSNPPESS